MASLSNHILTITEPTIKLDELGFNSMGEGEGNERANTTQSYDTIVSINAYIFKDEDIKSFTLKSDGVIPSLDLVLVDTRGLFSTETYPRDGDVINFRLASKSNETYKDIRIDFDIVRVTSPNSNADKEQLTGGRKYTFNCRMKIPGIYAENCKGYGSGTSLEHIESIANDLKLGLATNIDASDDTMNLVLAYNSVADTLEELVKHSYVGEESFQTYSIDPYYYINYVDYNDLLNTEGEFEDVLASFDVDIDDQPSTKDEGTDSGNKLEGPLVLTTHNRYIGTNLHIESYSIKNNAGSKLKKNGYKRSIQYYENDSEETGLVTFDIEALSGKNLSDIEEPLKGRRGENRFEEEVKHKYVGRRHTDPETSNTHLNYEYAKIHNIQNLDEIKKMTLEIQLDAYNPAIHRYQKIPIVIFHAEAEKISADRIVKENKVEKGFDETVPSEEEIPNPGKLVVDNFISGYYIVGGIQYIYKEAEGKIKQKLTLIRREWPGRLNTMSAENLS